MTIFFLLTVVAGPVDLPTAEQRLAEGAATPMRDVIAAAFDAPLRGFRFEHCGPDISLFLSAASECRVGRVRMSRNNSAAAPISESCSMHPKQN